MAEKTKLKSAKGKLGVLTPGMGAVATTFIAGVIAVRKGLAVTPRLKNLFLYPHWTIWFSEDGMFTKTTFIKHL